ncbi:ice-binding protein [Flavobacterium sp. DSP2-3-1]|uniref:ice-binding protein n=1 Tax=Flavobacterium sp. DSP2-3-1 TaxID=2804620 RepID=UPI003CE9A6AA
MKLKNTLSTLAMLSVVFLTSCTNDNVENSTSNSSAVAKSDGSTSTIFAVNETYNIPTKIGSQKPVNLGIAGDFAILSKTGITNVYKSAITGDIGSSPITGAAVLVRCTEVVGTIYTVDAAGPLPCSVPNATRLTVAVGDMQTAYTDAAGRINPNFLNLGAGNIGGKTLTPGLYKWTTALTIPTDITLSGNSTDVFIFQVAGTLKLSSAVRMTLTGGVQAKNIFWVVSDAVTCGTTSHFEGNILGMTGINLQTHATINGRLLAQTAVTLQMNDVTKP